MIQITFFLYSSKINLSPHTPSHDVIELPIDDIYGIYSPIPCIALGGRVQSSAKADATRGLEEVIKVDVPQDGTQD